MGQSAQMPKFTPFGTIFEPIGWINGKPVWPVLGGAPEDGEDGADSGTEQDGGQSATDEESGSEGESGDAGQSADEESSERPVSRAEFDRLVRQLSAADKRRESAEKKVKEFEDKDKTELEKAKSDLEAMQKRDSERAEAFKTLQMGTAFRDASDAKSIKWHNSALALKELDHELIDVEDDGTVKGMEKAIAALAKAHPYLVATEQAGGKGSSGGSFNGNSSGKKPVTDTNKLAAKYPALRGRGGQ